MFIVPTMLVHPPNSGLMLGQRRSLLFVQSRLIVYDAGPTLLQHWPSASYFYTSIFSNHWTVNQCCFNVEQTCMTMAQQQLNILYTYLEAHHCDNCYAGDTCMPRRQKGQYPDNTIHWPNCEIKLGHLLRCRANIIPTKTL